MNAACPSCFTPLPPKEIVFRCTGSCNPVQDQIATDYAGAQTNRTPAYRAAITNEVKTLPSSIPCRRCQSRCTQEICPTCHYDIPEGWRNAHVFTMAVAGARGAGKSVYIAVAMQSLIRYAQARACTVSAYTQGTLDIYNREYYRPLFDENVTMKGTPPIDTRGAYQRDPLIWDMSGGSLGRLFLVIRDAAGEDLQDIVGRSKAYSFFGRADLLVFLFDPMRLNSIRQVLSGVIPDVDQKRLGVPADKVLANVLNQVERSSVPLALTISKFDSLQQLPQADNPLATPLANPGAQFNRDDTMARSAMPPRDAVKTLDRDSELLDAELRTLYQELGQNNVVLLAEQAHQSHKIGELRHFAVSALGETPVHNQQLTLRGVSPFRVLDPILWGMAQAGFSF